MSAPDESTARPLTRAQQLRVFLGFAVQPFAAVLMGVLLFPLIDATTPGRRVGPEYPGLGIGVYAAMASVFVIVFAALPIASWRLPRRGLTFIEMLAWGVVFGNVPTVVVFVLAAITGDTGQGFWEPLSWFRPFGFGALFGAAGTALFWTIAVRNTPLSERPA